VSAARELVERGGVDALTMQAVAERVGVRAPSLYKRVAGRPELLRLVADQVAAELAEALDAAVDGSDPAADLRSLAAAFRAFARRHPTTYPLLFDARRGGPSPEARDHASEAVRRVVAKLAGPERELAAARMVVAWANGFVGMELAGAFQLGGDVEEAWRFGVDGLVAAISGSR
jgi:AcrR family transcriptional regulator